MANQEHLDILKQGVDVWNKWRKENQVIIPRLEEANLANSDLNAVDLSYAYLAYANLQSANLHEADLNSADLYGAKLVGARLTSCNLIEANMGDAKLNDANARGASLKGTDLGGANLCQTDFTYADFNGASLNWAEIQDTDFSYAVMGWTILGSLDFHSARGLETIEHIGPSSIGIDTIIRSQGNIPEIFLRKAGVPESVIENIPALINAIKPIEYFTCFISYSSKDQEFAERLYIDLLARGVGCWFAPHDMKTGDPIRERIDESIRLHDKLLLILSQNSVKSSWVETEVEKAFDKERKQKKKNVLFPIRLDDSVTRSRKVWAAEIQQTRHITDFTNWKQHDNYQKALKKLLDDLKAGE